MTPDEAQAKACKAVHPSGNIYSGAHVHCASVAALLVEVQAQARTTSHASDESCGCCADAAQMTADLAVMRGTVERDRDEAVALLRAVHQSGRVYDIVPMDIGKAMDAYLKRQSAEGEK